MNSKVSAIITNHNRSQLIKRAIVSVKNQTYSDIECIVVDDVSIDNIRQICSEYLIQYIFIPKEKSGKRNEFVYADGITYKGKLLRLLNVELKNAV